VLLFAYEDAGFTSLKQMRWAWDHILAFDSSAALRQVRCPALGVFGAADLATDAAGAAKTMRRELGAASGGT
jgi:hypothetical protein